VKLSLNIAVDVDGVLADFVGGLLQRLAPRGHRYAVDDVKHFELSRTLTPEALHVANDIMAAPGFARELDWYPGARLFLSILKDLGDVTIATAPFRGSPTWQDERAKWLDPYVQANDIVSVPTKKKHLVTQFADVLVEDRAETLESWKGVQPDGLAVLIDRPWNRQAAPYAVRVRSYLEAVDAIRTGAKKSRAA